jgi:hypothetical protein
MKNQTISHPWPLAPPFCFQGPLTEKLLTQSLCEYTGLIPSLPSWRQVLGICTVDGAVSLGEGI